MPEHEQPKLKATAATAATLDEYAARFMPPAGETDTNRRLCGIEAGRVVATLADLARRVEALEQSRSVAIDIGSRPTLIDSPCPWCAQGHIAADNRHSLPMGWYGSVSVACLGRGDGEGSQWLSSEKSRS